VGESEINRRSINQSIVRSTNPNVEMGRKESTFQGVMLQITTAMA